MIKVESHRDTEKGYGEKGPGIEYVYTVNRHYPKFGTTSSRHSEMITNRHGIYVGENNPRKFWETPDANGEYPYDYQFEPIDELDAGGKEHDQGYDNKKAAGPTDAFFNKKTIEDDILLVQRANAVIQKYKDSKKDYYTKQLITKATYEYALNVKKLFSAIVIDKITPSGGYIPNEKMQEVDKTQKELKQPRYREEK